MINALHYITCYIVFRKYRVNLIIRGWSANIPPEVLILGAFAPVQWHLCTGAPTNTFIIVLGK